MSNNPSSTSDARNNASRAETWRRRRPGKISRPVAVASALPLSILGGVLVTQAVFGGSTPAGKEPHLAKLTSDVQAVHSASVVGPADTTPGAVAGFGGARSLGGPGARIEKPVVGIAATPGNHGYWIVASDGGIFAYGDARFLGSLSGRHLDSSVVGIASTPTGQGYWVVASDGGIFAFGDARFLGSLGDRHLSAPIVGIASTPTGHGYWMVASDGGVFAFGDARFHGSLGGRRLTRPVVGIASTPTGHGYWMVASDGGVFAFGDAAFHGSPASRHLRAPVVGIMRTPTGHGYWVVGSDGGVFSYGDAAFQGSLWPEPSDTVVASTAVEPFQQGYFMVTAPAPPPPSASATHGGSDSTGGAFGACVRGRETTGYNWQETNWSGHYGIYQFSYGTWVAYGGSPSTFGHATPAQQDQVFSNAMAMGGESNWAPYDGC